MQENIRSEILFLLGQADQIIDAARNFLLVGQRFFKHFQNVGPARCGCVYGQHGKLASASQKKIIKFQGMGGFFLILDTHPVGKPRQAGVLQVRGHGQIKVG